MLQYVTKSEMNYEICNWFNNFALAFSKKQENLLQISEKKMCESLYYAAHKFKSIYLLKALAKLSHNLLKALANYQTMSQPVACQWTHNLK